MILSENIFPIAPYFSLVKENIQLLKLSQVWNLSSAFSFNTFSY